MNKDKLTALCHKAATEKGISFNVAMTYYFLEVILRKIAMSVYKERFIFKGGFLLSNIIGLESRTTSDMDFVIEQIKMDEDVLKAILEEILQDELICFGIGKVTPIKDEDPYGGYRIVIICQLDNIRQSIPLDIATGDPITPKSVEYAYKSLFFDEQYSIIAYNIETILAEKLETVYRRHFFNSRSKDFYDIFVLYHTRQEEIDTEKLKEACKNTFSYRNTEYNVETFRKLLVELKADEKLNNYWKNYQKQYGYAAGILYQNVIQACESLIEQLG